MHCSEEKVLPTPPVARQSDLRDPPPPVSLPTTTIEAVRLSQAAVSKDATSVY
jgi:hypothetical protein